MQKTIEQKFSTLSLSINNHFPFIHLNVFRTIYSVNGQSCEFSLKGVLLTLILALLPNFWDACPWNMGIGIAIGAVIAVLWNIFAFMRFRAKVRKLEEMAAYESEPEAYHRAPPPKQKKYQKEAPATKFDVTKKYFIAKYGTQIAFNQTEECCYLILAETDADMRLLLADNKNLQYYKPSLCHIDTVVQLANMIGCNGIKMITDSGSYTRPLTDITSQAYHDMLEDTLKSQDELFAIVTYSEDGAYYITSDRGLAVCLSVMEADALGLQTSMRYEIKAMNVKMLRDVVAQTGGLCILDSSKTMLYCKPKEHVLSVLDRM